ncbi:MAG: hypothetical protein KF812_02485 [Fimbriimonadaceae bacterium]|nr:hypothetical protein [Fimbriimonadaceae bacterium]
MEQTVRAPVNRDDRASAPSLRAIVPFSDVEIRNFYDDASMRRSVNNGPRLPTLESEKGTLDRVTMIGGSMMGIGLGLTLVAPAFFVIAAVGAIAIWMERRSGVALDSPYALSRVVEEYAHQTRRRIRLLEVSLDNDVERIDRQLGAPIPTSDRPPIPVGPLLEVRDSLMAQREELRATKEDFENSVTRMRMGIEMASLGETLEKAAHAEATARLLLDSQDSIRGELMQNAKAAADGIAQIEARYHSSNADLRVAESQLRDIQENPRG